MELPVPSWRIYSYYIDLTGIQDGRIAESCLEMGTKHKKLEIKKFIMSQLSRLWLCVFFHKKINLFTHPSSSTIMHTRKSRYVAAV